MQNQERMLNLIEKVARLKLRFAPLGESDLSFSQIALMASLSKMPDCNAKQVAEIMGLSAPTVSVALNRLEEGGWISRKPDPEDRRATRLQLTNKGSAILAKMRKHRNARVKEFLGGLDDGEQAQLFELLEKATSRIEQKQSDLG